MRAGPLAALLATASAFPAAGFPDRPPWEAADEEKGCGACHFDYPVVVDSPGIGIEGLPEPIAASEIYELVLRLTTPEMAVAGYLMSVRRPDAGGAGSLAPLDGRSESDGARARSTVGAAPSAPGEAAWRLIWQAPADGGPLVFEVWANAANGDDSRFGDRIHHHILRRTVTP